MSLQLFTKETELALYELISANSLNDEQSKAVTDFVFGRLEAFGASQAQQTTAELPEAAKCEGGWGELCVYYYTAAQMHEHYAAGVRAGMGQSQWQPIDSAPKDGTWILIWEQYGENPFVGYWGSGRWNASHEHVDAEGGWDGAVVVDAITQDLVSHWMPLPAAPKGTAMSKDTSGPAFPAIPEPGTYTPQGMTIRQWYAGLAMQGLIARGALTCTLDGFSRPFNEKEVTDQAFAMADAMLAEGSN